MTAGAEQVLKDAMTLTTTERAQLIERLLGSLDLDEDEYEARLEAEIESRIAAYDAGEMDAVPGDEVLAQVRSELHSS